jgi:hypothetical protein
MTSALHETMTPAGRSTPKFSPGFSPPKVVALSLGRLDFGELLYHPAVFVFGDGTEVDPGF